MNELSSELLIDKLKKKNFEFSVYEHPPFYTVDDSKKYRMKMTGGNTKNLYLRDKKKKNILVTVEENKEINLKLLSKIINCTRLSFGSSERLKEFLGIEPGSVSPLALINDENLKVDFFMDSELINEKYINIHPLINTLTVSMKTDDLIKFINSLNRVPKFINFDKHKIFS